MALNYAACIQRPCPEHHTPEMAVFAVKTGTGTMFKAIWRFLTTPFRVIPWYIWLAALGVAVWLGRNILVIIATVIVFDPIPVPPLFLPEPANLLEARTQDLQHFRHVRRNERSLDAAGRARLDAATESLRAQMGEMSDAEFQLGLARVQAVIDNGHSNASATRMVQPFPRLPIRSAYMAGELRVLRALPGFEDLLGARVTHINGEAVDEVAARFRNAFGGKDAFFATIVPLFLETPAYLDAVDSGAGDSGAGESVYRFEYPDGTLEERSLAPVEVEAGTDRVSPGDLAQTWQRESDRWIAFQPAGEALQFQNPDNGYWTQALPDLDAVYIALRVNYDDESGESLADFAARILPEMAALSPRIIILDQRFNGGGDLGRTHDLMAGLADITGPDGRVYLLAGNNTFSAGIVNLAVAKEAAPDRTRLVGEPIGDRLQFWAEGWWYNLPNSGFRARYSAGYYDLQNGCHGIFICPWSSLHIFPVIVDDLDIDIAAPLTFEAYAAGRDPGLEAIYTAEGVTAR
tara:strand:+ start:4579 stop:6135 length:1557 start_codon:yes stop_codon:yes gene_type:complete